MADELVQDGESTAGTGGGGVDEDCIHIINFQIGESTET